MSIALVARGRLAHFTGAAINSVATTRGIGWLIGPPPRPGSKEHKIKNRRLTAIGLVGLGLVFVCHKTSLYDDNGEFRPIFRLREIDHEMERAAQEAFRRRQHP